MSKDILVRMEIPIPSHEIVNTPALIFGRWFPKNESDFICIEEDNLVLRLWFDESCWIGKTDGFEISKHANVLINKVHADIKILGLSEGLVEYIKLTASQPHPPEGVYQQEYRTLGQKVYTLTLTNLNRLINYARSIKGQFWLQEYPIDMAEGLSGVNLRFKSRVLIDSEWYRWFSDVRHLVILSGSQSNDDNRFITQDTWPEVMEFVSSVRRSPLVWELLAGSEWLVGVGHRRSALTEAVTALESAISEFVNRPDVEEAFKPRMTERMNVTSLKNWYKRIGLSGTMNYLFPLIFPEDKLPTEILKGCQNAVMERQNVVHNGQRDVSKDKLTIHINSIKRLCWILEEF